MKPRKRTSSPFTSQKRVAFEIPASLQQFSTISRSLATQIDSHATATTSPSVGKVQSQFEPKAQSSPHPTVSMPTPSHGAQHTAAKVVPQKRAFVLSNGPSSPHRASKASTHLTGLQHLGNTSNQPASTKVPPPSSAVHTRTPVPTHARPDRNASNSPPAQPVTDEPALKPGEIPVLQTHPNLIAALIAKKRAENEAKGTRERWARRQAEYRMSKSPANQLISELNHEVSRGDAKQMKSTAISTPPPPRPLPAAQHPKASTPVLPAVQTPAAETVSTPATEASAYTRGTSRDNRSNDGDSLFGSPFSSPIAEFLERATDDAGLREISISNRMATVKLAPVSTSVTHVGNLATPELSGLAITTMSQQVSAIPPLFSDKPVVDQSQSRPYPGSPYTPVSMPQNSPIAPQHGTQSNTSGSVQTPGTQPLIFGSQPPLAARPPSIQVPNFYQQLQGVSGYYRIDPRQWPNGHGNSMATPTTASAPANFGIYPAYGKPSGLNALTYSSYQMGMAPYIVGSQPGPPPLPQPLHTYDATIAAATEQPKAHSGFMTAADMVAGGGGVGGASSTRFRIATKDAFRVPKRHM